MSTPEETPLIRQVEEFFKKKILENGYVISDNKTAFQLRRMAMSEFKIKEGSSGITKKALGRVMKEMKIQVPQMPKQGNGIDAKFNNPPLIPSPEPKPSLPTSQDVSMPEQSPRGSLPLPENNKNNENNKTPFIPNPEDRLKQSQIAEKGIGGIIKIVFERLSILEPIAKPKDEKEKLQQSEKLRQKIDSFSNKLGGTLYDKGIKLPSIMEYLDLGIEGYEAIVQPIIGNVLTGEDTKEEKTEQETKTEEKLKDV